MKCKSKLKKIGAALLGLALVLQTVLMPTASKTVRADDNPDPNFHIYIAFGQSNMEGNPAYSDDDLKIDEEHYLMMQTADGNKNREVGNWYPAVPPLANSNSKLSIADYFGRSVLEIKQSSNPDVKIGILVVAVAGCSIKGFDKDICEDYYADEADWMKNIAKQYGGNPYNRIIEMAKLAQKDGVIKGIIMHQGETDAGDTAWSSKVTKIYDDMIKDLDLGSNIPLIAGQPVDTNANIAKLADAGDNFYVLSSEGLSGDDANNNHVHFTADSVRTYGKRYAEKMVEVEPQYTFGDPVYTWSADNTKVTAKRVCNELSSYVEEETVDVTSAITTQPTTTITGTKVYTSKAFNNSAFAVQTKTETIPVLVATPTPAPTSAPTQAPTPTLSPVSNNATPAPVSDNATPVKTLKLSAVKCKKKTKVISGKVSETKATVKIKVGKKAAKKATVKKKNFTLKLSSGLKAKTKITITVSKKNFKTIKKTFTVK